MFVIAKCIRFIEKISFYLSNTRRKNYLRLKYPGIKIDSQSIIEKNCKIVCIDGGRMEITDSYISEGVCIIADSHASMVIDHSYIGRYTHIVSKGSIEIRSGSSIAEMVVIRDQDHVLRPDVGKNDSNAYNIAPIIIGENTWIAAKATILKGVTIGEYSIIAASATVTKSVPGHEIWGGIPAKFIKKN